MEHVDFEQLSDRDLELLRVGATTVLSRKHSRQVFKLVSVAELFANHCRHAGWPVIRAECVDCAEQGHVAVCIDIAVAESATYSSVTEQVNEAFRHLKEEPITDFAVTLKPKHWHVRLEMSVPTWYRVKGMRFQSQDRPSGKFESVAAAYKGTLG